MKKILVVEDDENIARALLLRLRASGYQVFLGTDGLSGGSMVIKHQPDLVILDIAMPAGGGFAVAEVIESNPMSMGTPIIFITASKDPEHRVKAKEIGAVAFFEKPYDADKLLKSIKDALGENKESE